MVMLYNHNMVTPCPTGGPDEAYVQSQAILQGFSLMAEHTECINSAYNCTLKTYVHSVVL